MDANPRDIMSKIDQYFEEAHERAKRRKSPWNLILIPLVILCAGGVYYFFWRGVSSIQSSMIPANTIFWSYTRVGSILMYVPLLFPSLPLGMMFANFIAWCIAPARKAFDREAQGVKYAPFKSATKFLCIASAVLILVTFPISFLGLQNYFYVNENGLIYHSFLRNKQYGWGDVRKVLIGCSTHINRNHAELDLNYVLIFQDGTKVDLWEDGPLKFLTVYDKIFTFLNSNQAIIYEQKITNRGLSELARRWSPSTQANMQKVLQRKFINE